MRNKSIVKQEIDSKILNEGKRREVEMHKRGKVILVTWK